MDTLTNFDKFDSPKINFKDLPSGMGDKVEVGDTVISKCGSEESEAKVIEVDKNEGCIYLSKELPTGDGCELSVKTTSTGQTEPYDAMKKEAQSKDNVLTGPLPDLKKFLIQISIEEK